METDADQQRNQSRRANKQNNNLPRDEIGLKSHLDNIGFESTFQNKDAKDGGRVKQKNIHPWQKVIFKGEQLKIINILTVSTTAKPS